MSASAKVTKGFVLRETETKETDKILTVLTPDLGKTAVIARGARRRGSKIAAASQLLTYSEMVLYERGGWLMLDEASTLEMFTGLRRDIELLALGSYFAELTEAVTQEGVPAQEVLSLLLNALYALDHLGKPPRQVKAAFELRLLCLSGYEPLLDGCAFCGAEQPQRPMLDVLGGVLRCGGCGTGGGLSMPLGEGSLAALRHIAYADPKRLYAFSLDDTSFTQLANACEAFCAAQLERGFRTLDFYKSLQI